MRAENGRGPQRRRRLLLLRTEEDNCSDNDNGERSGCSGQREHEPQPQLDESPVPTSNDEAAPAAAAAMTNERRAQRSLRSERTIPTSSFSPTFHFFTPPPLLSSLSSLSWRQMYYVVFTICWLANGASAAPTDRHERQPTVEILDGYVNYSIGNNGSSINPSFHELSRNAFLSLKGSPVEARFRLGTEYLLESAEKERANNDVDHQAHVDHLTRHHRKKNRKPVGKLKKVETDFDEDTILDGRKHALLQLADPDALINMNQRCYGQKFKQRIRVDGCLTKVVVNRLCHGTCASIFIPRMHSKKLKAAFRSCAACAPAEYDFVDITLDCPGRNPPTATKTIVKVKSCKCREVRISPL